MNRTEFMRQLEQLLSDIPENDRKDALSYYEAYFDEAGPDNEASVIQKLGSPGKVAGITKADLRSGSESQGEYTEHGYQEAGEGVNLNTPTKRDNVNGGKKTGRQMPLALLIILLVFASPLLLGLGGGIFGIIVGILGAIFGLVVAVVAGGVGCVIGGLATFVWGIVRMFTSPLTGLATMGMGALLLAVGLLFVILFAWLVVRWIPALFRWIANVGNRLLHRGDGRKAE